MKSQGVIEESRSPWVSPVVMVKKKDGSLRFCVDYRKLNAATVKDSYPLFRIEDILDRLSGNSWFSTLDLKSGYWQVKVNPKDKEKTVFSVGSGLWQFRVMPFGLCNAPATFERLMEKVLREVISKICLVYLDDVIVFSKTFEEMMINLRKVFLCLRMANLKINPKKCSLFSRKVKYLGHIVSEHYYGS
ncbi:integrase core domain protein [Lasius niger]|uniref:Integrase core domain protein n=1 Tax=Lasius niger TaxID=67767 RepID=A0A0J7MSK7_LASNI|nr:integrase core domain protein [Lasius niger]